MQTRSNTLESEPPPPNEAQYQAKAKPERPAGRHGACFSSSAGAAISTCIAHDPLAARGVLLDGDGAARRVALARLDGDGARACARVPEHLARARCEGRQVRARGVSCLVSCPSCSKALSGQVFPGRGTISAPASARTSMPTRFRSHTSLRSQARTGVGGPAPSAAPRCSSTCSVEKAKPRRGRVAQAARGVLAIPGTGRAHGDPGSIIAGRRPAPRRCSETRISVCPGAATPGARGRQRDGRGRRMARELGGRELSRAKVATTTMPKTGRRWPARRCHGHAGPEPLLCLHPRGEGQTFELPSARAKRRRHQADAHYRT